MSWYLELVDKCCCNVYDLSDNLSDRSDFIMQHELIRVCVHDACMYADIFVGLILMLWHRETHISPQRNRLIIMVPAGTELTTSRLRQLRQLPVVHCQLKFNICVRCDMAFIEPMHRNKPNITYLPVVQHDRFTPLKLCLSKNLNSTARPYDHRAFSPLDSTASWLSHLVLPMYMFVVVNFDALAQVSDIRIER